MRTINIKHLLATLMLLLVCTSSWSADGDTFTANTVEGVSMTFKVISESEKTCQVGNGNSPAIPSDYAGAITIPSSANGYSVTSIGEYAFTFCYSLTSITIPSSVARIENYAFFGCSGLTSVTIPSSVTSIGEWAFKDCSSLTSITIPSSVMSIGYYAFSGCSGLTLIVVNEKNNRYDSRENCNAIIETSTNTLIAGCQNTIIPSSVTSIGEAAFQGCSGLTSITIPSSVTYIGDDAFSGCSGMTSITIPSSVMSIGYYAFHGCSGLTSIIVDGGNPKYDSRENCNAIIETSTNTLILGCQNTIIPSSVTSIGDRAFDSYSGLTSITIPSSVTRIGYFAFNDCSGLTSITIPSSVTSIGEAAFQGCSGLTSVTIPSSVTSIVEWAFNNCSGLISITIPSSVTSIGNYAFSGCSGLTSVVVKNNTPVSISSSTFSNRTNATLYVPAGSKSAYEAAQYWQDFWEIVEIVPPTITFADANVKALCVSNWDTNYDGELCYAEAAAVTNLGEIFKKNTNITSFNELQYFTALTSVGTATFDGCSSLTSITIPSSVTSIGEAAFQGCSSLTSVTIPSSVTGIGRYAFSGCSSLTSITIPEGVTSIGLYAFQVCSSLTSVTIPSSMTSIGSGAFAYCRGLTSITIPEGVTSIGSAFSGCSGLTSIIVDGGNTKYDSRENCNAIIETSTNTLILGCQNTIIPSSVTSIGSSAFANCSGLTSITIPSSVTSIGNSAFYGCYGLTSITIPSSVTSIGAWAFRGCRGLTSITIPSSVMSIEDGAFSGCSGLTSIIVDGGNTRYDSRENCNAIIETSTNTLIAGCQNTIIPSSVTSIGESAFNECSGLITITIPEGVTSIGEWAFFACSRLTSITIPKGVTSIGNNVFNGCSNLTSVIVRNSTPVSINSTTFTNRANATLYVPVGSKSAYEAANYWKEFKEIKESTSLAISDASGLVGCNFILPINMTNEDEITAMQFELSLPEGVNVASAALTDRKNDHSIGYSQKGNGTYQFTVFSGASKAFSGNEGVVANISTSISNSMAAGSYTIQLKNIELTTTAGNAIKPSDQSATLTVSNIKQGDANGDNKITITDAVGIVNYILGHASSNFHPEAADLNGDNNISITDAVAVVNIILNQSAGVKERRTLETETEREPQ